MLEITGRYYAEEAQRDSRSLPKLWTSEGESRQHKGAPTLLRRHGNLGFGSAQPGNFIPPATQEHNLSYCTDQRRVYGFAQVGIPSIGGFLCLSTIAACSLLVVTRFHDYMARTCKTLSCEYHVQVIEAMPPVSST